MSNTHPITIQPTKGGKIMVWDKWKHPYTQIFDTVEQAEAYCKRIGTSYKIDMK